VILVPFTCRHLDTIAGVPEDAEWRYVGDSPTDYWRLLCEVWERGEDVTIVEHDVVGRPDVFAAFDACPNPWCVYPYAGQCHWECMEAWRNELGCTRFSAKLIHANPAAVSSIEESHRDWHNLCDGIGDNLRAAGWTHHWHFPAVVHHKMALGHLAALIGS
jgi:hypothetical protein